MAKNQILADLISTIKYKSGLNQSEIAAKIGVTKQYLSDTVNGRFPFNDDLKQKLYEQFTYLKDDAPKPVDEASTSEASTSELFAKALEEIAAQRRMTEKAQGQIDKLIGMLQEERAGNAQKRSAS